MGAKPSQFDPPLVTDLVPYDGLGRLGPQMRQAIGSVLPSNALTSQPIDSSLRDIQAESQIQHLHVSFNKLDQWYKSRDGKNFRSLTVLVDQSMAHVNVSDEVAAFVRDHVPRLTIEIPQGVQYTRETLKGPGTLIGRQKDLLLKGYLGLRCDIGWQAMDWLMGVQTGKRLCFKRHADVHIDDTPPGLVAAIMDAKGLDAVYGLFIHRSFGLVSAPVSVLGAGRMSQPRTEYPRTDGTPSPFR